jgi:hypothetical protein
MFDRRAHYDRSFFDRVEQIIIQVAKVAGRFTKATRDGPFTIIIRPAAFTLSTRTGPATIAVRTSPFVIATRCGPFSIISQY